MVLRYAPNAMKVSQAAWICLMTMLFGSVSAWSGSARIVLPHAIFDALNTTASLQKEASDSVATNQSHPIAVDNKPINKSSSQPQLPLHPNERQQTSKEISSQLLVDDPTLTDAQQQNQVLNQLEAQRQLYQQAIDALKHGQIKHYQTLKDKLNDYVLYPYLERAYLLDRIKFNNRHEIQDFLDTYGDAPVTIPVRYRFLHLLARKNQTALYLTYYRPMGDITLECHWFKFRLKTDENKENIFKEAERVWLYGKSRPNACDPVFAAMRKSGHLTPELIWSRLLLALNQRNASLVRYLSSLLPSKQKLMGIYAQNALAHPSLLARKPSAQLDAQQLTDIAVILLSKSLWRDPEHGLKLYQQAVIHFPFSKSQQKQLTKTIALALATNNHPKADEWLNLIPATEQDELLLRWKLAHELRQKNWPAVKHWLTHTQPPQNAENDWQYWLARAEQELGNHEQAYQLFEELAQKRSYYGFMASAVIGKQPNLQNKQYDFDPTLIQQLSYRPGILRAYELWKLKKHLSARREWNNEKETLDIKQRAHLAAIAHQWGWYDQAIFSLAETGLHDSVDMRFPLAFENLMQQAAKEAGIDLTLSLAIARKESAFMPDARSPVGAKGLMQLMPRTAQYIAKKENLPKQNYRDLFDPTVNVILGTRYLKQLLNEYQGNTVLATASYNAGRQKVLKWLPNDDTLPADIWIETVPYRETRSYIKNVLAYQQIYRTLLGQTDNYFKELVNLKIGKKDAQ